MRYNAGDKVRIKSLDWYNENKDEDGDVPCNCNILFLAENKKYLGTTQTVERVYICEGQYVGNYIYKLKGIENTDWTDEMIESLVEEETKPEPKFKVGDRIYSKYYKPSNDLEIIEVIRGDGHYGYRIKNHQINNTYFMWECEISNYKLVEEEIKSEDELLDEYEELTDRAFKGGYEKCKSDIELNGFQLPEGYIFKDENDNVINTNKIVLEKKKKEYPKTYAECCKVLDWNHRDYDRVGYKSELLCKLQVLLLCRDAYWKIAGEEMGLGKPWEQCDSKVCYGIITVTGEIQHDTIAKWRILTFPTEEMRDAFYENFKELIEICKELL